MRWLILQRIEEYIAEIPTRRPQLQDALRKHGWFWNAFYPDKAKKKVTKDEILRAAWKEIRAMDDEHLVEFFEQLVILGNRGFV